MAAIGLRYPVAAPIETEVAGSAITYDDGMHIGPARAANLTLDRGNTPFYGNDIIQDQDNGITGGTLEFESTQLTADERVLLLGEKATATTGEYADTDEASPYVGFGFMRVLRQKDLSTGTISVVYETWWFHKVQFSETAMTGNTKENTIQWQAPRITGTIFGVDIDSSGANHYYLRAEHSSEATAQAWLDGMAEIPAATTATTT